MALTSDEVAKINATWEWAQQPVRHTWRRWFELLHVQEKVPPAELHSYKPSLVIVCDDLMGKLVMVDGVKRNRLPSMKRRIKIFEDAIEITCTFEAYRDIATLAGYRRQVTNQGGITALDIKFFRLVLQAKDALTPGEIRNIAERMPPRAAIRSSLFLYAELREYLVEMEKLVLVIAPLAVAAE